MMARSIPRPGQVLAVLAVASLTLSVSSCSPWRTIETVDFLNDITAQDLDSRLKRNTPEPRRDPIAFKVADRGREADLYRPGMNSGGGAAEAGVVLVPGLTPHGKDDPRLVLFANTLARVQFGVLVPEIPELRELRIRAEHAEIVSDGVMHLAELGGTRGEPAIGLVALSLAGGLALLAALDDEVAEQLRFIVIIGGYYDIDAVVTYATTNRYRPEPGADWEAGQVDPRAKWNFLEHYIALVREREDTEVLEAIADTKREDPDADVSDFAARLQGDDEAVYRLLANEDPEAVPALVDALPDELRQDIRGMDLIGRDLEDLDVRVILIHGRDDPVIPSSESERLAEALGNDDTHLYIVDSIGHVDLDLTGIGDMLTLFRAGYFILSERDAAPAPVFEDVGEDRGEDVAAR